MEYKVSERKKITVNVPSLGKTLSLRKPTLGEQESYENSLNESLEKKKSVAAAMSGFLVSIGASAEDAKNIDTDEFSEIIQHVLGSKKN